MSDQLNTFAFNGEPLRVILKDGDPQPWFVAKDACEILGLQNHRQSVTRLDDDEKGVYAIDTLGGEQETWLINEPGLYRLVMTSRSEWAKKFQKWVLAEVLPQIRKTGAYLPSTVPVGEVELIRQIAQSPLVKVLLNMANAEVEITHFVGIPGFPLYVMDDTPKHNIWRVYTHKKERHLMSVRHGNTVKFGQKVYYRPELIDLTFPRLTPKLMKGTDESKPLKVVKDPETSED